MRFTTEMLVKTVEKLCYKNYSKKVQLKDEK